MQEERRESQVLSTSSFLTPQQSSQQQRLNAQLDGQNITHVWHANEVTFVGQTWQSTTQLLHSQSHCINSIITSCWILHIQTNSCFELNHNKFIIKVQSTFKLVGTNTQPKAKTFILT
jgi:hypothetical protein